MDHRAGEWHLACNADGSVADDTKGGAWKAAYHTTEMCSYVYSYLEGGALLTGPGNPRGGSRDLRGSRARELRPGRAGGPVGIDRQRPSSAT